MTTSREADRQQEAIAAVEALRVVEKERMERSAFEQQRLVVENFQRSERSKARLEERKQADVQALVDSEIDFVRRLDEREQVTPHTNQRAHGPSLHSCQQWHSHRYLAHVDMAT